MLPYLGFLFILVLLVYLTIYGVFNRGAKNWIKVGPTTIQPSELAKPVIIVCLALYFETKCRVLRNKNNNERYNNIAVILFLGAFIPILVFLQKDFGTMTVILSIFGIMFMASPILPQDKTKTIVIMLIAVVFGGLVLYTKQGYILTEAQLERFNFLSPCANYENGGYQICNGYIAINDGGLGGLGIGKSKQKYSYIPEPHTDSVFAIIAEEWGFIKTSVIFGAYIVILYRIFNISSKTTTLRGKYISLGVGTYIFLHILINLGGLFGLMPLTGIPLPFLSYGGSFTISLVCSLAIVQRINIENNMNIDESK